MNDPLHPALLPAGLRDLLPPDAEVEAAIVARLMGGLASHGYERVKPPLVEFEDSLLGGAGAAMGPETFRLMDPASHRMIGLRADMTLQVARLATTRLVKSPRPLRLSYAGEVLRVRSGQLRAERQFGQVGAELIGSDAAEADAEIVGLAAEILTAIGVGSLSVDLTLPTLVRSILDGLGASGDVAAAARVALDRKDAASITGLGGKAADLLGRLMAAAGAADRSLTEIATLRLPDEAMESIERLRAVVTLIQAVAPTVKLTIDPVENRGFEYHTGISFTLFARGIRGELGRGGRYLAGTKQEPATGFTLYTDTVIHAVPAPAAQNRLYVPAGTPLDISEQLRAQQWATVAGLSPVPDSRLEARRLGCSHILEGGIAEPL